MNFSRPFVRRPVMTTLLTAALCVFGIYAYTALPVSDLPNVDFPTILVSASLPGASPTTMASAVATPLERQFTTIAGLASMSSSSTLGSTRITLQFDLSRNLDSAAQDVQAAISAASRQLPPNMPAPPTFFKVNPAASPILFLALTSPTLPLSRLDEYGETMMGERISTVSGVAQVLVFGAQKYAVRVQLDPRTLAARGLSFAQVSAAIQAANVNVPTGVLEGPNQSFTLEATGQLTDADAFRKLIVTYQNGAPVRLGDLGKVVDSVENNRTAAWYDGERAVVLAVQRQPGTNTVNVARGVEALLPRLKAELPASVSLHVLFDRSESIGASIADVKVTLLIALGLVVVVIFLFLRNLRATFIPAIALPMSILGTFILMYLLGYSLDNLSMMALILCIGFVVDDAIVMLENIVRHIELGQPPMEAALDGSKEIVFTIVSMTLSLAAVFIPILFMGGIIGRLFREFSITIVVAILISGLISITLTPMLSSRLLRARGERHGWLYRVFERGFHHLTSGYGRALSWCLRHRGWVMLVAVLCLLAMIPLFIVLPKGFVPSEDTGQVTVSTQGAQGISFDSMVAHQQEVAAVVQKDPNVDSYMSSVASGFQGGSNNGTVFIRLKARGQRPLSADGVVAELRRKLDRIVGLKVSVQNPPTIRVGGFGTSQYQLTLEDPNTDELYRVAPLLEEKLKQIPGLADVSSDLELVNPRVTIDIDRDRAAALGVTPEAIENALNDAYGTRQVSSIYAPTNEYQVIMEVLPEDAVDPRVLQHLHVAAAGGKVVPLSAVASFERSAGPLSVSHFGQLPSVTLGFNLAPGASLGQATTQAMTVAHQVLPATVSASFQGTAQAFQSSIASLGRLLILAILVIYIVLGILYESFIHPITILSALPFAGFGALLTLWIFGSELDLYSFIGIILLIGLVKKNGIMMVDFALAGEREHPDRSAKEAIHEACMVRFRPILMTSVAALVGTLPIALGFGAGASSRRPLGLAVVGGPLFSQTLTLFVTPVFFTFMERVRHWLGWRRRRPLRPVE